MKKVVMIMVLGIPLFSCSSENKGIPVEQRSMILSRLESLSIVLYNTIYDEQIKKITHKEAIRILDKNKIEMDSLTKLLPPSDTVVINDMKQKIGNDMVDRLMNSKEYKK